MSVTNSPRLLIEPSSPFVPRPSLVPIDDSPREPPLAVTILKSPYDTAKIILAGDQLDRLAVSSLVCIGFACFAFVVVSLSTRDPVSLLRSSVLLPGNLIFALAAALGPIYAASIVYAARIPMARLVSALLTSAAAGAMILAAAAPLPWFAFSVDPKWLGPLGLVLSFALAGLTVGYRLKTILLHLARASSEGLLERDEERVVIIARIASMVVGLTIAIALWGFDVFLPVY